MGRTVSVGRVLGFSESFPFFQIGRMLWAQLYNMCLHFFRVILVPRLVPDSSPRGFVRVKGFGQRVIR